MAHHAQHLQRTDAQFHVTRSVLFAPLRGGLRSCLRCVEVFKHAKHLRVLLVIVSESQRLGGILGLDAGKAVLQKVSCDVRFAQLRVERAEQALHRLRETGVGLVACLQLRACCVEQVAHSHLCAQRRIRTGC